MDGEGPWHRSVPQADDHEDFNARTKSARTLCVGYHVMPQTRHPVSSTRVGAALDLAARKARASRSSSMSSRSTSTAASSCCRPRPKAKVRDCSGLPPGKRRSRHPFVFRTAVIQKFETHGVTSLLSVGPEPLAPAAQRKQKQFPQPVRSNLAVSGDDAKRRARRCYASPSVRGPRAERARSGDRAAAAGEAEGEPFRSAGGCGGEGRQAKPAALSFRRCRPA
jgi:hypothetical protein